MNFKRLITFKNVKKAFQGTFYEKIVLKPMKTGEEARPTSNRFPSSTNPYKLKVKPYQSCNSSPMPTKKAIYCGGICPKNSIEK